MQQKTTAPGEDRWDVIVVGAGPAGAVAALLLSREGWRVALVDRRRFPRDKVCGDGLVPDSIALLRRIGLLDQVASAGLWSRLLSVSSPDGTEVELRGEFLCVKRLHLDELLVRAAQAAGAELIEGDAVARVETDDRESGEPSEARATLGSGRVLKAHLVILATGAAGLLLDTLTPGAASAYTAIAARAYYRSNDPGFKDRLVISYHSSIAPGYGWLFPLPNGEYNAGCGIFLDTPPREVNLRKLFDTFRKSSPYVTRFFETATPAGRFAGAPLRCGMRKTLPVRDRLMAIGEAQGATYPFSGEGIGKAMETAALAAEVASGALRSGDFTSANLGRYTKLLESRLQPIYRSYASAQRSMAIPWLANLLTRRAARSPYVRALVEGTMDGSVPPGHLFRPSTFLRSLFG